MNGGSYKKRGGFNFGCFRFVCKKDFSLDFLNEDIKVFCNHHSPKTQGFL
ncbi:hypothetical protein HMPREF1393_00659 [Helicobacter pylori GAM103Bi]|nr:hypothetical protein HMPREF1393_00659 [Helicobacter pylori GAM103Bi]